MQSRLPLGQSHYRSYLFLMSPHHHASKREAAADVRLFSLLKELGQKDGKLNGEGLGIPTQINPVEVENTTQNSSKKKL